MDIQKNDNSGRMKICLGLIGVISLIAEGFCFAETSAATEVLIASYKSAPAITRAEAESAVAGLEKALADCADSYLAYRIRYRIGVLYFKAGRMELSKARFRQAADGPECPELIRACGLNMIGQISRLEGKNEEALKAFNDVVELSQRRSGAAGGQTVGSALARLWCSALFSRAEIYTVQRDHTAGITEYNRLLEMLGRGRNDKMLSGYVPLVNDRVSQLYMCRGDVGRYMTLAERLAADYPEYYRTPIVKLEVECVRFMRKVLESCEFVDGSFGAPARAIAHIRSSKGETATEDMAGKLEGLCKEYANTYGGILLRYHYAWFLDALGQKEKAAEVLARAYTIDVPDTDNEFRKSRVVETVQEYAKIQSAIMLAEAADYKEALRVLSSLRKHPDESHISELVKSVTESVQILRREVPKNEGQ